MAWGGTHLYRLTARQLRPLWLVAQMVLSAGIGWLFSRALARQYGLCQELDGFLIAHNLPYLGWNLLGFAVISGLLTLLFAEALSDGRADLENTFATLMTLCIGIGVACVAIGWLWSEQLTELFAPGLTGDVKLAVAGWIRILSPLGGTVAVSALWSAILGGYRIPFASDLNGVLGRLLVLAVLLVRPNLISLNAICWMLVVASVLSLVVQWRFLRVTIGLKYRPMLDLRNDLVRRMLRHSAYFLLASIAIQTCDSQMRRLTTLAEPGTATAVGLCFSLYIPLSVILGRMFAFAYGPTYMELRSRGKLREARGLLMQGGLLALVSCGGLALVVIATREPLMGLLFGGGQIDQDAVTRMSNLLAPLLFALPSVSLQAVLFAAGLGAGRANFLPIIWSLVSGLQFICMGYAFVWWGPLGIMWSYALASYLQLAAMALAIGYVSYLEKRESPRRPAATLD